VSTNEGNSDNWRNLIAACLAISIFAFAFGLTYPLLSLILEERQVSTQMIGLNAAMMPLGILLFAAVIPVASRRFGATRVAITAALVTAVLMLCYRLFPSLQAWFILRLLHGMTISTLFVLSEAWIVRYSFGQWRGRIVAIYASVMSLSFAAGPAFLSFTGTTGWLPFAVGAVVILLGTIPLYLIREVESAHPGEARKSGVMRFLPKAPLLLGCVAGFAVFDAATLSLLPIYAMRNGLSFEAATMALTVLIAGNVVLQFPIGYLADHYQKRLVLIGCSSITVIALLLLPLVIGSVWLWPVLILGGATGYGVYTVALSALGDDFDGQELIDGTAAFASMWGLGALLGAMLGGWSMAEFGAHGLPLSLAAVYALLVIGLWFRKPGEEATRS